MPTGDITSMFAGTKPAAPLAPAEEPRDLGFGSVVADESRLRLLNRDGSFNVLRRGLRTISKLRPPEVWLDLVARGKLKQVAPRLFQPVGPGATVPQARLRLGALANDTAGSEFTKASVAEILIYDAQLNDADITLTQTYLMQRYGLR